MPPMTTSRARNLDAVQWNRNGDALGTIDLTDGENVFFGDNVFSLAEQRKRLSKDAFKKMQAALEKGEALDTSLADEVADAMKEWALERGATHYTHWFQPLTGLTAEKHDSFFEPDGKGGAIAEFSRQGADPGRARRLELPDRRHPRDLRGPRLHGLGPDQPGVHPREPERHDALHPDRLRLLDRRGARREDPAAALDGRALASRRSRVLQLFGDEEAQRVFTTVGPEQEYFLIDEQYFFARPDLVDDRAARSSAPSRRRARSSTTTTSARSRSGSSPACSRPRPSCTSSASRSRPATTRSPRASTRSRRSSRTRTSAPTTSSSTMQIMQSVARRYGLVCLLHEKPFAGVNGSGKHNNWSMGTDTGAQPARARRHPGTRTSASCSSAPR